jgi:hypothetical protein
MKRFTKVSIILLICLTTVIVFKDSIVVSSITKSVDNFKKKITPKPTCYHRHSYFNKLNDSVHNYLEESYLKGIKKIINRSFEIPNFVKTGALIPLKDNQVYIIDTLEYSYAFLTPRAEKLLFDI